MSARWRQVKALFQAAVERPPEERSAFLAAAAGGDEALRREVESLLASDAPNASLFAGFSLSAGNVVDNVAGLPPHSMAETKAHRAAGPGSQIGSYRIIATLGAGGMGEVFRAHDSKLHRDVALKVLPEHFALDADRLSRFRREAQMLAALNHPNIAAIYGLEETGGRPAFVLELVEGRTLAEEIATGPIPPAEALVVARQLAEALRAAHRKGIIHRDLKPANIKITPDSGVKVLDFGLAKPAGPDQPTQALTESASFAIDATPRCHRRGRTNVVPLTAGSALPPAPLGGFRSEAELAALPGVEILPYGDLAPGRRPALTRFHARRRPAISIGFRCRDHDMHRTADSTHADSPWELRVGGWELTDSGESDAGSIPGWRT